MLRALAVSLLLTSPLACSQGSASGATGVTTSAAASSTGMVGATTGGATTGSTTGGLATTGGSSGSSGGSDGGLDAGVQDAGPLVGILVGGTGPYPGPIFGVHYRTTTQSGFTSDAGAFSYLPGETVTFSISSVDFAPTPGAPDVSPWQLASPQTCAPSAELTDLLVFLYSLDVDGTAANGTQVPAVPMGNMQQSFSSLSAGQIDALIAQLLPGGLDGGAALDAGDIIDGGEAVIDFITQMDGEVWQQIALSTFTGVDAEYRSQGVSTDGTYFYFSWQLGFDKTDLSYNTVEHNSAAIPASLLLQYDDHIGDNDYWDGGIYAGIEDDGTGESHAYTHPHLGEFDDNLNFLQSWALSDTLMTEGVPWVAVDGPNGHLIIANWDPTPALFLMDLTTGAYLSSIPLSQTLSDIQGAKLFEGSLYTSAYDADSTIAKIDMATGVVIVLWHMTDAAYNLPAGAEEEGCVFLDMADGSQFHTLDNDANAASVEFRHHQRIRDPLRKAVCQ